MSAKEELPKNIRVSIGSAITLGLMKGKLEAKPTTAYLLTYRKEKCEANCKFCSQSKTSQSRADTLSRVIWPIFPTKEVLEALKTLESSNPIKRVCIQTLNYPEVFNDLQNLAEAIHMLTSLPISISCQPLNVKQLQKLKEIGVDRVSIALDTATEENFNKIKGVKAGSIYSWENHRQTLLHAVEIFGKGFVTTHLIVGLGETEEEMTKTIQWCIDNGICPGLFAFTPIKGTVLANNPPPPIETYRRIQVARHLIVTRKSRYEEMKFNEKGNIVDFGVSETVLGELFERGEPFLTTGCPDCNRPYYNEKPGGIIYNYPRALTRIELNAVKKQLKI
jgi:biotin synthase